MTEGGHARQIGLLLILYVIQAIPLGLSAAMPLVLQTRGASYSSLGKFGLSSLPFSLKLLWAPLVDATRLPGFGRRKSWLVPTQTLCGGLMLFMGSTELLSAWSGETGGAESIRIWPLTVFFLTLYFLMATQDVAVDGWALELLPPHLKKHASTCNTIGQSIGFYTAYIGFLLLNDHETCNKFFRSEPQPTGLVTLGGFLQTCGAGILCVTAYVALFEREGHPFGKKKDIFVPSIRESPAGLRNADEEELVLTSSEMGADFGGVGIGESYRLLGRMLRMRPVQIAVLVLMTCRAAFGATEAAAMLKVIEAGVKKEQLALLAPLVMPWGILSSYTAGRLIGVYSPLQTFKAGMTVRLAMIMLWCVVFVTLRDWYVPWAQEPSVSPSLKALCWLVLYLFIAVQQMSSEFMFVSQMAFFAQVSDPTLGGTYMTFFNTVANLGNKWPSLVALFMLERCRVGSLDGFIVESLIGLAIGVVWLVSVGRVWLRSLQATPVESWKIPRPAAAATKDFEPLNTELVQSDGLVTNLMRRTTENISSVD